jgi:2C-methyl-D-erythritol 2,4-cyclodiphosphate synthase
MKIVCIFILTIFCVLSVNAQKSNDRKVVDELKKITGQLNSIKGSNKELQKTVSGQIVQIEQLNKQLSDAQGEIKNVSIASNSSIMKVSNENEKINDRVAEIGNSINRSSLLFSLLCLALAISGISGFLYLLRRTPITPELNEPPTARTLPENDLNKFSEENTRDTEFLDVLTKTYSLLQEQTKVESNVSETVDHSLPLKVGDEIHRMRKRIENMPQEVKGLGALKNSLIRLEEEINAAGYVMVDLLGRDYNEGIICEARFVESASVPRGREIITEVLKPQINHNGQLIQVAKIEVGKSYDEAK